MTYQYVEGYIDPDGNRHIITTGSSKKKEEINDGYVWSRHGYSVIQTLPKNYIAYVSIDNTEYKYNWNDLLTVEPIFRTSAFRAIMDQLKYNNILKAVGV